MGTQDISFRNQPWLNSFFDNKRVIDIAAGDKFSVVVAETFDLTKEEEDELFGKKNESKISAVSRVGGTAAGIAGAFNSTKRLVRNTKVPIADQKKIRIPNYLRANINTLLESHGERKGKKYASV